MSSGRSTSPSNERSQGGGTRRPFVDREIDPTHLQVAECRSDRRQPGRCSCQRPCEEEPSMPAHHENQLRGEPRVEQRRAEHMKLKLFSLATLVVATALAAFAAAAGPASATPSPVVGQVYVNDNTAVANTV